MVGRVAPPQANTALLSRHGDGPRLAASRDCVESHISLKESLGSGGAAVISDLGENGGSIADTLTGGDNKARSLDELHVFPFRVARDGLVQPLRSDCRAVGVARRHQRELEEGGRPSVQNLNIY